MQQLWHRGTLRASHLRWTDIPLKWPRRALPICSIFACTALGVNSGTELASSMVRQCCMNNSYRFVPSSSGGGTMASVLDLHHADFSPSSSALASSSDLPASAAVFMKSAVTLALPSVSDLKQALERASIAASATAHAAEQRYWKAMVQCR